MLSVLKNLPNLTGGHYVAIGMLIGAVALQISGLSTWHEATTPAFIGGTLGVIASVLQGIGTNKPQSAVDTVSIPR